MTEFEFDMVRGFNAATRGESWDPYETIGYHEGYELWLSTPTAGKKLTTEELEALGQAIARKSLQLSGSSSLKAVSTIDGSEICLASSQACPPSNTSAPTVSFATIARSLSRLPVATPTR